MPRLEGSLHNSDYAMKSHAKDHMKNHMKGHIKNHTKSKLELTSRASALFYNTSIQLSRYCPASFKKLAMISRITRPIGNAAMIETL